jgi:hypothetical protein
MAVTESGVDGGVVSGGAGVVADAGADREEWLAAASTASTV